MAVRRTTGRRRRRAGTSDAPGSSRSSAPGAPEYDGSGRHQVALADDVVLPVLDLHVEATVDLEDHHAAVATVATRRRCSAVEPEASRRARLPVREAEPVAAAHPSPGRARRTTATRRRCSSRVARKSLERRSGCSPRSSRAVGRRGEPLLDDGRQRAPARCGCSGGTPANSSAAGSVRHVGSSLRGDRAERSPGLHEAERPGAARGCATSASRTVTSSRCQPPQATQLEGGQPADRAARTRMQHARPHQLLPAQLARSSYRPRRR